MRSIGRGAGAAKECAVTVEYFTFDLGDHRAGLLHRIRNDESTSIEVVEGGAWVDHPDGLKYLEGFRGIQIDLVALTEDEARAQAQELGVSLDDNELVSEQERRDLPDDELVALIISRSNLDEERAREALAIIRGGPPAGIVFESAERTELP